MYNQGGETTQEMTTNTVGLWPSNFGSGLPGCKRWEYKVLESYKTNLECSAASPPVHKAKFSYDAASGCPDFLHIQVRTEFKLEKSRRYTLAEMKKTLWSSYIRHISVRLEAHVKRTEPHDFFIIPALNKSGAHLKADVEFAKEVGTGPPITTKSCEQVDVELGTESKRKY
jgi:hypothetical protein